MTVIDAVFVTPANVARILTVALDLVLEVVSVNDFDADPAGTTTLDGTETSDGDALDNVTVTPPAGAGAASVTVAAADVPPTTLVGLMRSDASAGGGAAGGVTVSVVVLVAPL